MEDPRVEDPFATRARRVAGLANACSSRSSSRSARAWGTASKRLVRARSPRSRASRSPRRATRRRAEVRAPPVGRAAGALRARASPRTPSSRRTCGRFWRWRAPPEPRRARRAGRGAGGGAGLAHREPRPGGDVPARRRGQRFARRDSRAPPGGSRARRAAARHGRRVVFPAARGLGRRLPVGVRVETPRREKEGAGRSGAGSRCARGGTSVSAAPCDGAGRADGARRAAASASASARARDVRRASPAAAAAAAAAAAGGDTQEHMPRLFSFPSTRPDENGGAQGVEAYFHGPYLVVEATGADGRRVAVPFTTPFTTKTWRCVAVEYEPPAALETAATAPFATNDGAERTTRRRRIKNTAAAQRGEVRLYLDGAVAESHRFCLPRVSGPLGFCCFGTNPPAAMAGVQRRRRQCALFASLGPVYVFRAPSARARRGRWRRGGAVARCRRDPRESARITPAEPREFSQRQRVSGRGNRPETAPGAAPGDGTGTRRQPRVCGIRGIREI